MTLEAPIAGEAHVTHRRCNVSQSELATWQRQNAAEARAFSRHGVGGPAEEMFEKSLQADALADELLKITDCDQALLQSGCGGEPRLTLAEVRTHIEAPGAPADLIAADASRMRLGMIQTSGVLPLAVDAAETVDASNSVQQMLAHELAVTHALGMKLTELGSTMLAKHVDYDFRQAVFSIEAVRLLNTAARLFETTQRAALTINRLKTAGKQTLVVQHVHVADGGQAVVAGAMRARRPIKKTGQTGHEWTKHPMHSAAPVAPAHARVGRVPPLAWQTGDAECMAAAAPALKRRRD